MKNFDISTLPETEPLPGFHLKKVQTENLTIAFWRIEEGSVLPEHSHPNEQTMTMLDGEMELTVGGETKIYSAGMGITIPENVAHTGKALSECILIDIFYPKRKDL